MTAAPASSFPARHPRHQRDSARTTWRGGRGGQHVATPLPRTQPRRLTRAERLVSPSIQHRIVGATDTHPAPSTIVNHRTAAKYSPSSKPKPAGLGVGRRCAGARSTQLPLLLQRKIKQSVQVGGASVQTPPMTATHARTVRMVNAPARYGSFAASTSSRSITGGAASRVDACSPSAAAMRPARCASRPT
jgi:hypothetical protein